MCACIGDNGSVDVRLCFCRIVCTQFGSCDMSFWPCFLLESGSKWQRVSKPCLWPQSRGKAQLAVTSYGLGVYSTEELVGIEPTAGLLVTAMAASPWIAP